MISVYTRDDMGGTYRTFTSQEAANAYKEELERRGHKNVVFGGTPK